jgi:hypothetical protein
LAVREVSNVSIVFGFALPLLRCDAQFVTSNTHDNLFSQEEFVYEIQMNWYRCSAPTKPCVYATSVPDIVPRRASCSSSLCSWLPIPFRFAGALHVLPWMPRCSLDQLHEAEMKERSNLRLTQHEEKALRIDRL